MPLSRVIDLWKNMDAILSAKYLKKTIEAKALKLDE